MKHQNHAAKFAFFYMLSMVALLFMALAAGMIVFQIINKSIVDIINQFRGRYSPDQLKFAISALVISAPIYYLIMHQIYKNLLSGDLDKDSGIRKWLTYFILFVSSVVMIGWMIATLNSFLDGELTVKFILKALTALSIAAAIFSFYFYDIKREKVHRKDKIISISFYTSLAVVILIFASSLFVVESPMETRNRKLDNNILDNFNIIDRAISTYHWENKKVPENLEKLRSEFTYLTDKNLKDPVTEEKFIYKIISDNTYELCAVFRSSNMNDEIMRQPYKDRWPHESGQQCLKQIIRNEENREIKPVPMR